MLGKVSAALAATRLSWQEDWVKAALSWCISGLAFSNSALVWSSLSVNTQIFGQDCALPQTPRNPWGASVGHMLRSASHGSSSRKGRDAWH